MGRIIDGKRISSLMREEIKKKTEEFISDYGYKPGLAVILVGNNPASEVYVRNKEKACVEVGFNSFLYKMEENTTEEELLSLIDKLKKDSSVHGILVQLPLPKHISENRIIDAIPAEKDADAFNLYNVGKIFTGDFKLAPCTPAGIIKLLEYENVDIEGKECVVVGRSNIVGKPIAMLLLSKNGTVTVCHSRTKNLSEVTSRADILVVAIGKEKFIKGDMIKEGSVIIDVGINRMENGKLCGDVDFDSCIDKCSLITPVPGGVGPMTITMLLYNTLTAAVSEAEKTK